MDSTEPFQRLQLGSRPRTSLRLPQRVIPIVLVSAFYSLLWFLLPHNVFYWVGLLLVAALVWVATHGWRPALAALIKTLQRLERIQ